MWLLWAVIDHVGAEEPPRRWAEDRAADQDAIGRLARGDADALGSLYDRHARPIYSLVLRILDDQGEAEDVVQDVFSQAWKQAARYDATRGSVAAWLLTIARSRAIDRVRARRAQPGAARTSVDAAMRDLPDPAAGQEVAALTAEQVGRLRLAISRLPLLQRIAIELAYYEGMTQSEIAERLEQPLGTVKTRIRLGLLKLREDLMGAQS